MSTDEALTLLEDAKRYIEPYRAFGPMVDEGIRNLDEMKSLISCGKMDDAYKICCSLMDRFGSYRAFVPELAAKMDRVKEILTASVQK